MSDINYEELQIKELEKIKKSKDRLEKLKKKHQQQSFKSLYEAFGNHILNQNEIKRLEKLLKDNNNELLNKILDNPIEEEEEKPIEDTPATEFIDDQEETK